MGDLTDDRHSFVGFSHCLECAKTAYNMLRPEVDALRKQLEESQAIAADYEREIKDLKQLVDKTFNENDVLAAEVERLREAAQQVVNEANTGLQPSLGSVAALEDALRSRG